MANGKIPNINNKFYGEKLVEVTFPGSTGSLGFDEYNAVLNNVNASVTSSIIMEADYALNARIQLITIEFYRVPPNEWKFKIVTIVR